MFNIGVNDVDFPSEDKEIDDSVEECGPKEPIGNTGKRPGNHDNKTVLIRPAKREPAAEIIIRRAIGLRTAVDALAMRVAKACDGRHERTQDQAQDKTRHQDFEVKELFHYFIRLNSSIAFFNAPSIFSSN